jgi:hypothetical protein
MTTRTNTNRPGAAIVALAVVVATISLVAAAGAAFLNGGGGVDVETGADDRTGNTFVQSFGVAQAAELTRQAAEAPGPRSDPDAPHVLELEQHGVAFPNLEPLGWKGVGVRFDELDGRQTATVFYERNGRRIGYSIVGGAALAPPADGETVTREGVELTNFALDGDAAVTWQRGKQLCILSGDGVPEATLVKLAVWKHGDIEVARNATLRKAVGDDSGP